MRLVGRAIADYEMIRDGDRILLGVSGGKDSLSLLQVLRHLQRYAPVRFDLAVIIEERVPVFSFHLGIPDADALDRIRAEGIVVMGSATTVAEARALSAAGVDAIVAQNGAVHARAVLRHEGITGDYSVMVAHDDPLTGSRTVAATLLGQVAMGSGTLPSAAAS